MLTPRTGCSAAPDVLPPLLDLPAWPRHTIDSDGTGADGARVADADKDGLLDVVTPWEEDGRIRLYLHPGYARVREPWPAVTVGRVGSPEDAVLCDLDGDGAMDVVSCCEGQTRSVYVHWAPEDRMRILASQAWTTEAFPALAGKARWMFALPLPRQDSAAADLIVGAKEAGAAIGLFCAPAEPRRLDQWQWIPWRAVGWTMSILPFDMDGDGHIDILCSDRRGPDRGVYFFQNPGGGAMDNPWPALAVMEAGAEYMFLDVTRTDHASPPTVWCATLDDGIHVATLRSKKERESDRPDRLLVSKIPAHPVGGTPKSARAHDLDGDGKLELVYSCENAFGPLRGILGVRLGEQGAREPSSYFDISGPAGIKFDRLELVDLDGDGDFDLLTTEERDRLGVIWYENPAR